MEDNNGGRDDGYDVALLAELLGEAGLEHRRISPRIAICISPGVFIYSEPSGLGVALQEGPASELYIGTRAVFEEVYCASSQHLAALRRSRWHLLFVGLDGVGVGPSFGRLEWLMARVQRLVSEDAAEFHHAMSNSVQAEAVGGPLGEEFESWVSFQLAGQWSVGRSNRFLDSNYVIPVGGVFDSGEIHVLGPFEDRTFVGRFRDQFSAYNHNGRHVGDFDSFEDAVRSAEGHSVAVPVGTLAGEGRVNWRKEGL